MPVLAMVAAIFGRCGPMPLTIRRPWLCRMRSTAAAKAERRSTRPTAAGDGQGGGGGARGGGGGGEDGKFHAIHAMMRPRYPSSSGDPNTSLVPVPCLGRGGAFPAASIPPPILAGGERVTGRMPSTCRVSRAEHLAEFGVVFMMFSIGLNFRRPSSTREAHVRSGTLQVPVTMAIVAGSVLFLGYSWHLGDRPGGFWPCPPRRFLSKLLAERLALDSAHGRDIIGVLLFAGLWRWCPAGLALALQTPEMPFAMWERHCSRRWRCWLLILYFGQHLMRRWFQCRRSQVFRSLRPQRSNYYPGLSAQITEIAGLSLAWGLRPGC